MNLCDGSKMCMKKRRWCLIIIVFLCSFLLLWFSGVLPKQVAKIVADNYMAKLEDDYEFNSIGYSSVHDSYFVSYFLKEDPEEHRGVEIPCKYFPFIVLSDSDDYIDK